MSKNIDLTKILKGCPKGTKFYHLVYGKVYFVGIDLSKENPICLSLYKYYDTYTTLSRRGLLRAQYGGECLLFPSKDQRDWSKFERFWDKPKKEKFNPKAL